MTHMEREWQVGRALSTLEDMNTGVPGFMSTGSAVVTKSGVFRGIAHSAMLPLNTNHHSCICDTSHLHATSSASCLER